MRIILKIARAELRNLFFSPIAWLMIIIFYILVAAQFTLIYTGLTRLQDVTLEVQPNWSGLTIGITKLAIVPQVKTILSLLYLFIPLLTMGIINRETSAGTIKLLYSSPITSKNIVIGKFLALVALNTILLLILAIFIHTAYVTLLHAEYKWYLSMLLGLFLLLNAYSAIGIFISSLTNYQIVAAILTFAVFFLLSIVGSFWQQYDLFRDISYFLSISGKVEMMLNGLITSRDIMYFILIIFLFLSFTVVKLNSIQQAVPKPVLVANYLALFFLVITIGYFTSRSGNIYYKDVTHNKVNTILPQTQAELKKLDGTPLKVTLYTNLLGKGAKNGLPKNRNAYLWGLWEQYKRFYPNIEFEYIYYYDVMDGDSSIYRTYPGKTLEEIVAIHSDMFGVSTSIFKTPAEIRSMIDLSPEGYNLIMEVDYKGKKEWLRTFVDPWPDESNVAATIKRLLREDPVYVSYLSGHYERNPFSSYNRAYSKHLTVKSEQHSGINLGFDTDTILLSKDNITAKTKVFVIADPKSDFSLAEKEKIIRYLEAGGNAIILGEPGKQYILNPILETLGVILDQGMIVQPNKHEMAHIFMGRFTEAAALLSDNVFFWHFKNYGDEVPSSRMTGSTTISIADSTKFKIVPILVAENTESTWLEHNMVVVDSAAPIFSIAEGDVKREQYVVAVQLTRNIHGKEQRIIVGGDSDMMSNMDGINHGLAFYSWTLNNEYPVYTNRSKDLDRLFTINNATAKKIQYVFLYGIPTLLVLFSIVTLVRRKRK